MGKRSSFERRERDFYPTPASAVLPLMPHIIGVDRFIEPCCGDGALVRALEAQGKRCVMATDVEPRGFGMAANVFDVYHPPETGLTYITNPPWDRRLLHPIIMHLSSQMPTWLLFDGDWAHTKQAADLLHRCRKIVSVGRVKWIPDSRHTGKDNCAWYLFEEGYFDTVFYGRS